MVLWPRVLRALNVLIAVAAVALVAGVWWYLWRPLPQTSGTARVAVDAPVEVVRDARGIPYIRAASQADALFAQGYVTASERLWQMDALRRTAAGDLCEIVGPAALEADKESRQLRMRRMAETIYGKLSTRDLQDIGHYARGVNAFIDSHRGRLSFEFAALGYTPRPWSAIDTILIWLYMFRDLSTSWPDHLQRARVLAHGDAAKVALLFPARGGGEIQPGSNAWVVSGARTPNGHPELSSDMHLEYSIPGIWFAISIQAPGLHVAGVSLPGAPGVIVGHNERIAWGATNLHFNVQDLYREKLDGRTGQYEFRGQMEQARLERDLIPVKGAKPVEFTQWVTRHGPVMINEDGQHYALRWTAADAATYALAFLDIDRARNWSEFNAALAGFPGPGQNFVYADVDGNIGYHATGQLPIRRNFTGDTPLDGASGENEWDGFIPYESLPSAYNPPSGIIATANQNPFPANYPYTVSGAFASTYRVRQIFSMLRAQPRLTPEEAMAIQKDVYSEFDDFLARALVRAWDAHPGRRPDLQAGVDKLRNFNGQMDRNGIAPLIASLTGHYVRAAIVESASPGSGSAYWNAPNGAGIFQLSYEVAQKIVRERPPGWFADYDEMLLDSLRAALDEARRMQGRDLSKWRYGRYMTLEIDHPIGRRLPLVADRFDIGPVPMSGGATTVKQTTRRLGPSERFDTPVGDWERSLLTLPVGESGHVLSSHYRDQWDAYYNARGLPFAFDRVEANSRMVLQPR